MTEQTQDRYRRITQAHHSRREFIALSGTTIAGLSILGLAGCGGDEGTGSTDELILSISPDTEAIVKPQIARFNKQGGAEASLRLMPSDTGQYFDQLRTQFQAGGGDISVIAGDVAWPPQFAANGWITDLSDQFSADQREQFLPGAIEGDTFEDQVWGVPWFTDCGLLYYRQDLLEASGYTAPPQTWEELMEMAAKVQTDAGIENGFVFTGAVYEGGTVLGIEFVRTAGGEILEGDQVVVASPEAVQGLTIQRSLVAEGISPEAVANFKEDEASGAFLRGDAVFMRMWPYAYDFLSDPQQSSLETSQVGLSQVPVASTAIDPVNVGGGWSFYVNANTDPDVAWELIQFMSAPEQQKQMALEGSYLPTRPELYEDEEIIKALPAVRLGKDAILNTTTPPVSAYYSDMSLAMSEQFNANILGDSSPQESAEALQSALEEIIAKGG